MSERLVLSWKVSGLANEQEIVEAVFVSKVKLAAQEENSWSHEIMSVEDWRSITSA